MLRCVVGGVTLIGALSQRAIGQDTLSDSAWRADIARRAAARLRSQAQRDSAALLVDSIHVSPSELILHLGDTLTFPQLLLQVKTVGRGRDGSVIVAFRPTFMIPSGGKAVVVRNGQVIAAAVGEGELWVKANGGKGPFDDARPTSKIRLIVR